MRLEIEPRLPATAKRPLTRMPVLVRLVTWFAATVAVAPMLKPAPLYTDGLAANLKPNESVVYERTAGRELHLEVFQPAHWAAGDRRPAFVTIHGGGWSGGSPRMMYAFADHFARLGWVGISVEYRLLKLAEGVTVFDCVKDARAAVSYVRGHAADLGIDPGRIVVSGASAGGHLALATVLFDFEATETASPVSCRPKALVLLSPVVDTSIRGYGNSKLGSRWRDLSPVDQVRAGMPPTLIFHGTADATVPYAGALAFTEAMQRAGNRCELVTQAGGIHTYSMKDPELYSATLRRIEAFLTTVW